MDFLRDQHVCLEHVCQQWPPGEMRAEVIDHESSDRGAGFHRRAAVMRLHDDIGQLQELGRWVGRALEYVEGGVTEPALCQRRNERVLVRSEERCVGKECESCRSTQTERR